MQREIIVYHSHSSQENSPQTSQHEFSASPKQSVERVHQISMTNVQSVSPYLQIENLQKIKSNSTQEFQLYQNTKSAKQANEQGIKSAENNPQRIFNQQPLQIVDSQMFQNVQQQQQNQKGTHQQQQAQQNIKGLPLQMTTSNNSKSHISITSDTVTHLFHKEVNSQNDRDQVFQHPISELEEAVQEQTKPRQVQFSQSAVQKKQEDQQQHRKSSRDRASTYHPATDNIQLQNKTPSLEQFIISQQQNFSNSPQQTQRAQNSRSSSKDHQPDNIQSDYQSMKESDTLYFQQFMMLMDNLEKRVTVLQKKDFSQQQLSSQDDEQSISKPIIESLNKKINDLLQQLKESNDQRVQSAQRIDQLHAALTKKNTELEDLKASQKQFEEDKVTLLRVQSEQQLLQQELRETKQMLQQARENQISDQQETALRVEAEASKQRLEDEMRLLFTREKLKDQEITELRQLVAKKKKETERLKISQQGLQQTQIISYGRRARKDGALDNRQQKTVAGFELAELESQYAAAFSQQKQQQELLNSIISERDDWKMQFEILADKHREIVSNINNQKQDVQQESISNSNTQSQKQQLTQALSVQQATADFWKNQCTRLEQESLNQKKLVAKHEQNINLLLLNLEKANQMIILQNSELLRVKREFLAPTQSLDEHRRQLQNLQMIDVNDWQKQYSEMTNSFRGLRPIPNQFSKNSDSNLIALSFVEKAPESADSPIQKRQNTFLLQSAHPSASIHSSEQKAPVQLQTVAASQKGNVYGIQEHANNIEIQDQSQGLSQTGFRQSGKKQQQQQQQQQQTLNPSAHALHSTTKQSRNFNIHQEKQRDLNKNSLLDVNSRALQDQSYEQYGGIYQRNGSIITMEQNSVTNYSEAPRSISRQNSKESVPRSTSSNYGSPNSNIQSDQMHPFKNLIGQNDKARDNKNTSYNNNEDIAQQNSSSPQLAYLHSKPWRASTSIAPEIATQNFQQQQNFQLSPAVQFQRDRSDKKQVVIAANYNSRVEPLMFGTISQTQNRADRGLQSNSQPRAGEKKQDVQWYTTTSNSDAQNVERSPIRLAQKTVNTQGTPRQTVILKEGPIITTTSPQTTSQNTTIRVVQGQAPPPTQYITTTTSAPANATQPSASTRLIQTQELSQQQINQLTQTLSQHGVVQREGNRFIVKQQVPVQIQERVVEVEKPVYIEKQIIVENREEIEQLKQRILQLERINQDYYLELTALRNRPPEIQTQEKITYVEDVQRIHEMEGKIQRLLLEVEGLNRVIMQQKEEIEVFRKRWSDADSQYRQGQELTYTYQREIDILREKLAGIQDSHLEEREVIKVQARRIEEENGSLRRSVEDLSGRVSNYELQYRELETYKNRYNLLIEEYDRIKADYGKVREQLYSQEQRLAESKNFEDELLRLRQLLDLRERDLQEWQSKYSNIEKKNKELIVVQYRLQEIDNLQNDNRRLSDLLVQKNNEIQEVQVRLNSVYADNGDLANKIRLLEQSLQSQAAELDRARQNYSAKVQEFDSIKLQLVRVSEWEGRARDYENRIAYQKSEYDAKINRLAEEIQRLNDTLRYKTEEGESLRAQTLKLQGYASFETDNRRLSEALVSKNREADELRSRLVQYEQRLSLIKNYEIQIQSLQTELERSKQAYSAKISEIDELRKQQRSIAEYEQRFNLVNADLARAQSIINQRETELQQLKQQYVQYSGYERAAKESEAKNQTLIIEIDRLRQLNSTKLKELDELRLQLSRLAQYEARIRELETINAGLQSDVQRNSRAYQEKLQETQNLRVSISKYSDYEVRIRDQELKIQALTADNERLSTITRDRLRELDELRLRTQEYIEKNKVLESRLQSKEQDLERNRSMLHSKIQESDQIRLSLTANAATQQRITQLTSELDQQRALYRIKCDEVDKLRFQYTKELEEWRSRASRLHASDDYVNHLKSEIERLSYRATVLSGAAVSVEENQRLRERLSTVVVENDRLKSTLVQSISPKQSNIILTSQSRPQGDNPISPQQQRTLYTSVTHRNGSPGVGTSSVNLYSNEEDLVSKLTSHHE